jgi:hypothetical protein
MAHPEPFREWATKPFACVVSGFDGASQLLIESPAKYYGDVADKLIGKADTSLIVYN